MQKEKIKKQQPSTVKSEVTNQLPAIKQEVTKQTSTGKKEVVNQTSTGKKEVVNQSSTGKKEVVNQSSAGKKEVVNQPQLPVAVDTSKALVSNELSDELMQDSVSNTGFENMTAQDIAIPFIGILQALSPQLRGPTKIEGAVEGDFFNNVTGKALKAPLVVVPCAFNKAWVEWKLRENNGGGFVQQHDNADILNETEKDSKGRDILDNGNHIVTTAYHYCVLVNKDGSYERVVLPFVSTQLKKSRKWNAQMMNLQIVVKGKKVIPPMYSHMYSISTEDESNEHGTWKGYLISNPKLINDSDLYTYCKKFYQAITSGLVKVTPPPEEFSESIVSEVDTNTNVL